LIEEFTLVKSFFPSEKGKRITWYDEDHGKEMGVRGPGRKRKLGNVDAKIEEIQNRIQESSSSTGNLEPVDNPGYTTFEEELILDDDEVVVPEKQDLSKEFFRGLQFEQWFYIFMQVYLPLMNLTYSSTHCYKHKITTSKKLNRQSKQPATQTSSTSPRA
jgi:hypothetical protein